MTESNQWFEVIKHKEDLYVIREKLAEIDPRFNSFWREKVLNLNLLNAQITFRL